LAIKIATSIKVSLLFVKLVKSTSSLNACRACSGHVLRAQAGAVNVLPLAKVLIALLLLLWMAASLSSIFWRLFPSPELSQVITPVNASAFAPIEASSAPGVDINALKAIALFGKETPDDDVPVVEKSVEIKSQVEETKLNLKLVGSFASDDKDLGYAIIAKGKKQEVYSVGDELLGLNNVKLIGVYSERVILNNKGRQEALYMFPEGEAITAAVSQSKASPVKKKPVSIQSDLTNRVAELRLQKISDAIRFSRKTKDGKMLGFRVLPGRNRKAFEQTGLKLNDVITAIDGQILDNLKVANTVYQEKKNATQASLSVLRGEEELTIDVDLNNINLN